MIRKAVLVATMLFGLANGSGAQSSSVRYADVPFGVGEKMTYAVRLGLVGEVGTGSLEVLGIENVHGYPTYQLRMFLDGGVPFAHVRDDYRSWFDTQRLFSRRFRQDQKEVRYKRQRTFEFFPDQDVWRRTDKNESGPMATDAPLDDLSFLYYTRTLPLEVGKTYSLSQYFINDRNPVILKVLRKETITVGAGTFKTVVVQPVIKTSGLFSEDGRAEVYFTDDARRIPVAIKSRVKVLKTLDMLLESYQPGERLAATQ